MEIEKCYLGGGQCFKKLYNNKDSYFNGDAVKQESLLKQVLEF